MTEEKGLFEGLEIYNLLEMFEAMKNLEKQGYKIPEQEFYLKSDAVARVEQLLEAKSKELEKKIKDFGCHHKYLTCEVCLEQFDMNGCNIDRILGFVNEVCSQSQEGKG